MAWHVRSRLFRPSWHWFGIVSACWRTSSPSFVSVSARPPVSLPRTYFYESNSAFISSEKQNLGELRTPFGLRWPDCPGSLIGGIPSRLSNRTLSSVWHRKGYRLFLEAEISASRPATHSA